MSFAYIRQEIPKLGHYQKRSRGPSLVRGLFGKLLLCGRQGVLPLQADHVNQGKMMIEETVNGRSQTSVRPPLRRACVDNKHKNDQQLTTRTNPCSKSASLTSDLLRPRDDPPKFQEKHVEIDKHDQAVQHPVYRSAGGCRSVFSRLRL